MNQVSPLKQGGTLFVYKIGQPNRHGPTPTRKFAIRHEHPEDEGNHITFQTGTHLIGPAVEYVKLAVRTTSPAGIVWGRGSEEVEFAYNRIMEEKQ